MTFFQSAWIKGLGLNMCVYESLDIVHKQKYADHVLLTVTVGIAVHQRTRGALAASSRLRPDCHRST